MEASYLKYEETGTFSRIFLDYIAGAEPLSKFYGNRPDINGFKQQIESRSAFYPRAKLVENLLSQNRNLPHSQKTIGNIKSLISEDTFTITTGHQLNLFTGPLYFIYKIVSTIKLTAELARKFPDKKFVPVYWMASEDHDFEEINHTFIGNKFITWPIEHFGPTGRLCTEGISETVKQYQAILGISANSKVLSDWVESAYLQNGNLAEATRSLVHSIFQDFGLVIIDADHTQFKEYFLPYMIDELKNYKSEDLILTASERLLSKGYHAQVTPREINLFYMNDNRRNRIIRNHDGDFEILDRDIKFSPDEIFACANQNPQRFSPNVVLRPLYQELLLPNVAYVGGGAEIAYWLQLGDLFERHAVPLPILVPRNSALILNARIKRKIDKMGLRYVDFFRSLDDIKTGYVRAHTSNRLDLENELREFQSIFTKIAVRARKIDPTLIASAGAVEQRLSKALKNLEKKMLKAEKRNHAEALVLIEKIKNAAFPNEVLQERIENFGLYFVRYGDEFVQELFKAFRPLDFQFTVLH